MRNKDIFDTWQYLIFRIVVFILFVDMAFKFVDAELHISRFWNY